MFTFYLITSGSFRFALMKPVWVPVTRVLH